jgi:protein SCO1/2
MRCGLALAVAGFLAGGCGTTPPEERNYEIRGQIVGLRQDTREVRLAHEDIPGLMQGMTMSFGVQEGESLEGLQLGDLVRATLIVSDFNARLAGIERTGHAPLEKDANPDPLASPPARPPLDLLEPGQPVPDQSFIDQDGQPFSLASTRGRAVALTFIYTRCPLPDFCPLMDRNFLAAQRAVEARTDLQGRVQFLSVSFDPEFDTPPVLRRHAETLGAHLDTWRFLTAGPDAIDDFATRFGVSVAREDGGTLAHNLRTAVIGPDGLVLVLLSGTDWTAAQLVSELAAALKS